MNVFFDVDDTLITFDVRLRPGVHEVFERLAGDGHQVYLWSGHGPRWEVVKRFELKNHILDCFWKPLFDHHARLEKLGVPFAPDFAVDDYQEIVDAFGGMLIRPPVHPLEDDREMWRAYDEITAFQQRLLAGGGEA